MTVLFCPFCEESFEDADRCPEHDLELVPFERLRSRRSEGEPEDDEAEGALLPARLLARAGVVIGAVVVGVGFALPMVDFRVGPEATRPTAFAFASEQEPNLWAPLFAALLQIGVLAADGDRRAPMLSRMIVPAISLLGALGLSYTAWRIVETARMMAQQGQPASVSLLSGTWVMLLGLALTALAGLRLGR